MKLIDKDVLIAEINRILSAFENSDVPVDRLRASTLIGLLSFIDTLEVKEVGIAIPNIDDLFEEDGIDPDSKDIKVSKECYYSALERFKEKKGGRTEQ